MSSSGEEGVAARSAIVMVIDDHYVLPLAALLKSIAQSWQGTGTPHVVLLSFSLAGASIQFLQRCARATGVDLEHRAVVSTAFDSLPSDHLTQATYGRLAIPDCCPDLDRAVYLDADTIVFRSLHELLELEIGPWPMAAVQDVINPRLGSPLCLPGLTLAPPDLAKPYFNCGLLVMDLRRWRSERLCAQVLSFARGNARHLRFHDQDAMNAVLAGRWLALDRRWNVPAVAELLDDSTVRRDGIELAVETLLDLEDDPWILHYTGIKPWWGAFPPGRNRDRFARFLSLRQRGGRPPR
jgi:lipopolysaccharide biosynthesis glycosyltransferase